MRRFLATILTIALAIQQTVIPVSAQTTEEVLPNVLPVPGEMVRPSDRFDPVIVKGLRVNPDNPLQFDFIVDTGTAAVEEEVLKPRAATLIKYFLTALTVPDEELWVNLSPYEQDRIIPDNFGVTDMGRDLLAQDYLLKQLTASLMYPEEKVGQAFWDRVYQRSQQLFGNTDIQVDTFNKVWVVPERAKIYISGDVAFIVDTRLKVMMEKDYLALQNNALEQQPGEKAAAMDRSAEMRTVSEQLIKEVLIPVIEEEVNHGEHFAPLRQIYHSLILATWFKQNLRESYLSRVYVGENKINGIDIAEKEAKERIYRQYLKAFETGVYNYVREEYDPGLQEVIPRKYFSGGMRFGADIVAPVLQVEEVSPEQAVLVVREETRGVLQTLPTNITPVDGAATTRRTDAAILSQNAAVDLGDFITYRKLFLSDRTGQQDALSAVARPQDFQTLVEAGREDREPAKIDFLITRQAPIQQSVLELIANASDAITGRSTSIGRFGVGALQMLAFVLDADNPALEAGAHIFVDTKTETGEARRVQFFKGEDGRVKFNILAGARTATGTAVRIVFPQALDAGTRNMISSFIEQRTNLFTKMQVNLNGRLVNPLDEHIFLNGDKVRYDFPGSAVKVDISANEIRVEDTGTGMSDSVLLDKYLIPRRGENQDFARAQTDEEIEREVHIFYKGPQPADQRTPSRIVFQVGGINIQSVDVEGYGLPRELIIQLPSTTKLTVSRDKIEIDETTHTAVRSLARKIVESQPIHQVSLMNGFMQAVQLLDEVNTRVEALQPLVDTAKEIFVPFVLQSEGLILPNDELFRQMDVPADTLFLHDQLTYSVSPDLIPGAASLERAFQPGRFAKAYTVPFKPDSDVTFLEAGPYLLINQAVYEKYKDQPMLLNLRLNYYRGYGRREAPRGTILAPSEQVEVEEATDVLPLLEEFGALSSVISARQAEWMQQYFRQRTQPTLKELSDQIRSARDVLEGISIDDLMRKFGRDFLSGPDGTDKAVLSGGRDDSGRVSFIGVNKDIDASEARVRALFERLNAYVEEIPAFIRDRIDWNLVLPLKGRFGAPFETLLENMDDIMLPDGDFLSLHAAFFLNQDYPARLNRYLENLQQAGRYIDGEGGEILHRLLATLDLEGLAAIDAEVLDTVARVFENRNMESMEEAFEGINGALPFVTGEGVKRLITRWLRIYEQEPKAAMNFAERLRKGYATGDPSVAQVSRHQIVRSNNVGRSVMTPDGTRLITLDIDENDLVIELVSGAEVRRIQLTGPASLDPTSNIVIDGEGEYVYIGGENGKILQFDVLTGQLANTFTGQQGFIDQLLLSEDGRALVSASHQEERPGTIRVWNTASGEQQAYVATNDSGQGTRILFGHSDNRLLVMRTDGEITEYDATNGAVLNQIPAPAIPLSEPGSRHQLLVTPDRTRMIRIGANIEIIPMVPEMRRYLVLGEAGVFEAAVVTRDSRGLALPVRNTESGKYEIFVYDISEPFSNNPPEVIDIYEGHDDRIASMAVSPDGSQLISHGTDNTIKFWDLRSDNWADEHAPAESPRQVIDNVAVAANWTSFSPDGQWIVAGVPYRRESGQRIVLRLLTEMHARLELQADRDGQKQFLGNPDDEHIVTADSDGMIRIRRVDDGEIVTQVMSDIETEKIASVNFVEDTLVIHSTDNYMEVWDRNTSSLRHKVGPELVAMSPGGKYYLASGVNMELRDTHDRKVRMPFNRNQTAKFVKNASGEVLMFVTDMESRDTTILNLDGSRAGYVIPAMVPVNDNFRLSSDGRFMLVPSIANNQRWELWDLRDGRRVKNLEGVLRAEILADLPIAVVERVDAPHVQMVDLETGAAENEFMTGQPPADSMRSIVAWQVSKDNRYLVYTTGHLQTEVWDLQDNKRAYTVQDDHWMVRISPDNQYLALISPDMLTIKVLDIHTGESLVEWKPQDGAMELFAAGNRDDLIVTSDHDGSMKVWRWSEVVSPDGMRTGLEALNPRDNLEGIPSLLRTVIRFLREEDVTLLEQEQSTPRQPTWRVRDGISEPISLALLNNLYESFAKQIQANPDITFTEFLVMVEALQGRDLSDYVGIIRSAIEGQDKTQRAWVREIAVQNARDATRRAREEGSLEVTDGQIEIRNYMEGDDWVFTVRDRGTGMNLFHLIRYFFPLDQSSKDYLTDTGNLGQGNYTLFADFDRVFLRTSTGDGIIHELQIVPDAQRGPVIESWEVLAGFERGTEIRRIKNNQRSDPQLESLFIQEALQRFAGGITSPDQRAQREEAPNVRDVRVVYNGEEFADEIDTVSALSMGEQWGDLVIGRAADRFNRRVMQDGIFIKEPDQKELLFVPPYLQALFERRGGLHISLPRNIQLNIPRTGYSQEHKFLKQLQVSVLHNILKSVLRDYVDNGVRIPGMPADYFDNFATLEREEAQDLVRLLYTGRYDEVDTELLASFVQTPTRLFTLLAYLPFESDAYTGEMTLHEIRERFIVRSRVRSRNEGAVAIDERSRLRDTFEPKGEFAADLKESVGTLSEISEGLISGRLQRWVVAEASKRRDPAAVWSRLPQDTELVMSYLVRRFLQPVVGEEMPDISFYDRDDNAVARSGTVGMLWNLAYNEGVFSRLMALRDQPEQLEAYLLSESFGNELWGFLETLFHESQHLPQFEEPGDHTHHEEAEIEGLDPRTDQRFGVRMGRAIDAFLTGLQTDIRDEFRRSPDEMRQFIEDVDNAARQRRQNPRTDSAVLSNQPSQEVGGIDLNPNRIDLEVGGDNSVTAIPLNTIPIETVPVEGFYPVILNVIPTNLPLLLGSTTDSGEEAPERQLISALRDDQRSY